MRNCKPLYNTFISTSSGIKILSRISCAILSPFATVTDHHHKLNVATVKEYEYVKEYGRWSHIHNKYYRMNA